jgi:threonine dehydrogenase-like Zn-dependent dehydrogenase
MRGVTFPGNRRVEILEFPDPAPGEGEVVVEMKASGICGSDLHMYRNPAGKMNFPTVIDGPVIRGHEPCGIVVEVGPGVTARGARAGQRVMVHHYWGCGHCRHCRTGWAQMCDRMPPTIYGIGAHGGHARFMTVPAGTLVALPDELSFEAGAAIACGTGTAYSALVRHRLSGGDTIAIYGQGPVGLAATQMATAMGARVIAVDISPERLAFAARMGAAETVDSAGTDPVEAIRELTGGGADHALDASGATAARTQAVQSLRPWGTLSLVGVGGEFTAPMDVMMRKQITVFGSWTFNNVGQADCAAFAVRNGVKVDDIFTDRWTIDDAKAAYEKCDAQSGGKGVILF